MKNTPVSRLIGAALLIPALLGWLLALVLPTVQLVVMSLQNYMPFRQTDPEFVGMKNYDAAFDRGLAGAIVFGVSLTLPLLLVFFLTGPLLGWAASHAQGTARRVVRVVLMLPLAAFVPVAAAFAWLMRDFPQRMPSLDELGLQERLALIAGSFGLVCALAVTVYGSVFRPADRPRWGAALAVSGLAILAGVAMGVQIFGFSKVMPGGRGTLTAESQMLRQAFAVLKFGEGAAIGTVEFVVLAILGLLATAIIAATGLRISVLPRGAASRPANAGATAGLIIGALLIVGLATIFLLPWLGGLSNPVGKIKTPDFAATWIAPLLSTLFAVFLGVLGGFGIGALRPLGKFSELLLVPFAPWLFTGTGLYVVPAFKNAAANDAVGSFFALIPPLWMFVPALFLFTLLFRGQADRAQEGTFLRTYVLPVVPAVVIATAVFTLVQAQDFLWSLTMSSPDSPTAPAVFIQTVLGSGYLSSVDHVAYSIITPLWLIPLVVLGAIAAQWFYADRVEISTSEPVGVNHSPE